MIDRYKELTDSIVLAAKKMYALRYEMSNGGNISIRIPDSDLMIIKGTDVAFDEITISNLVIADFKGHVIEGNIKPSKESLLHGAMYYSLHDIGAIMHCHSPYATAWAAYHDDLEFATYHAKLKLGFCPVFDTHSYAVPEEYFPMIVRTFHQEPKMKAFILRAHGQFTVGRTIREASYLAELVEETAQIAILAHSSINKDPVKKTI